MNRSRVPVAALLFSIVSLTLAGCAGTNTPSSRFYVLTSLADAQPFEYVSAPRLSIAVGPVILPGYLDRPEIVTRSGQNKIEIAEFHRWAGPIVDNVPIVLEEDLALLLADDGIAVYPWESPIATDYQVRIDILRFDGEIGGNVTIRVRWMLLTRNDNHMVTTKTISLNKTIAEANYTSLIATQSEVLAELSRAIATGIRESTR